MKNVRKKNSLFLLISIILIGLGIAIIVKSETGAEPFTAMTIAVSSRLGMSLTLVQGGINVLILMIVLCFDRTKLFIGTVVAMFFLAPVIEFWDAILSLLITGDPGLIGRIMIMLVGCMFFVVGGGIYLGCDMGLAPYDIIGVVISERRNIPYRWVRMSTDAICVIIAFLLGGIIGLGTLCTALLLGPIAGYIKDKVKIYLAAH